MGNSVGGPKRRLSGSKQNSVNQNYKVSKTVLGRGGSSQVVEAKMKNDVGGQPAGTTCAIKMIKKTTGSKANYSAKALYNREVAILKQLQDHDNIVKLFDHQEARSDFYIVMQLCSGGSLRSRISTSNPKLRITEKSGSSLFKSMLDCIQYCHSKNIVHADIKPENFLFETNEVDSKIILVDFGTAVRVDDLTMKYNAFLGTSYYMAPEVITSSQMITLDDGNRSKSKRSSVVSNLPSHVLKGTDVWGLGIVAFVMITGLLPFSGVTNDETFHKIVENPVKFPEHVAVSSNFSDLVKKLLDKNPVTRMKLKDALKHPWITGISEERARISMLNQQVAPYLQQFNAQSKLKMEVSRLLATNMAEKLEEQIEEHFRRLDTNNDHKLDAKDLKELLADAGTKEAEMDEEISNIMKQVDVDQSGSIDFEEFKMAWQRRILSRQQEYIVKVFSALDLNNDGKIDASELHEALGDEYDIETIQAIIQEVNPDGTNTLSLKDFSSAMKEEHDEKTTE